MTTWLLLKIALLFYFLNFGLSMFSKESNLKNLKDKDKSSIKQVDNSLGDENNTNSYTHIIENDKNTLLENNLQDHPLINHEDRGILNINFSKIELSYHSLINGTIIEEDIYDYCEDKSLLWESNDKYDINIMDAPDRYTKIYKNENNFKLLSKTTKKAIKEQSYYDSFDRNYYTIRIFDKTEFSEFRQELSVLLNIHLKREDADIQFFSTYKYCAFNSNHYFIITGEDEEFLPLSSKVIMENIKINQDKYFGNVADELIAPSSSIARLRRLYQPDHKNPIKELNANLLTAIINLHKYGIAHNRISMDTIKVNKKLTKLKLSYFVEATFEATGENENNTESLFKQLSPVINKMRGNKSFLKDVQDATIVFLVMDEKVFLNYNFLKKYPRFDTLNITKNSVKSANDFVKTLIHNDNNSLQSHLLKFLRQIDIYSDTKKSIGSFLSGLGSFCQMCKSNRDDGYEHEVVSFSDIHNVYRGLLDLNKYPSSLVDFVDRIQKIDGDQIKTWMSIDNLSVLFSNTDGKPRLKPMRANSTIVIENSLI